jgi:hypothetical protein
MAITTYSELQAAIGNWLDHSLFTSRTPEFIALFEAAANRPDTAPANWLLNAHPDLYLFGSLIEAEMLGVNDERAPMWKARRDEIFDEVEKLSNKTRGAGAMRVMGSTP